MNNSRYTIDQQDHQTTLVVPMPRPYLPIPAGISGSGFSSIVLVPLWLILSGLFRWLFRVPVPPRAFFEVKEHEFRMQLVDPSTGAKQKFVCDAQKIIELRKNQFETGLWIRVAGESMNTFLMEELPDCFINELGERLKEIVARRTSTADAEGPTECVLSN